VTPVDAVGQLLVRPSLIPATSHSAPAAVVTHPLPLSARAQLTVDTASMLPLGVVVTPDTALSKVRHMSPEMAKSLLQQSGQSETSLLF